MIAELLPKLIDASWVVRRGVIESLASLGEPAVRALCGILLTQRDNEARIAAAVDALVMTNANVDEAIEVLVKNADPAIVADAAQILGRRRNHSAIPTLVRLTQHADDNVAVGAIEGLGRIGGRAAIEAMIESINTGNFFRVFPAIDVLGRSGDPRAIAPLSGLLENPSYLPEAARALGRSGERAAIKPLLKILKSSSDAFVRLAAIALIELREKFAEKSGGDILVIDELIRTQSETDTARRLARVLSSSDVAESVAICKLLGAIGGAESAPALTAALDSDPTVAKVAAEALKRIGKEADEPLLVAIREGGSERRKALLPVILSFNAAGEVATCLFDEDSEVRALACGTLARLGNGSVVEKIFPLLNDPSARVVHAAIAAIQALGNRKSRELAVEAAFSANAHVRRSALRILAYFGDDSALEPMLKGLQDSDSRVREVAIQGLPYLESSRALEALFEAAKSPIEKTRALAMRALGLVPKVSERAIAILLKGLCDSDSWVRYYSCQSLGRLQYDPATLEIVGLLEDPAGQVRVSAVEALSHMQSPVAHKALRAAATSNEVEVNRAALVGLGLAHRPDDLAVVLAGTKSEDISTKLMALSALASFKSPLAVSAMSAASTDTDEQVSSTAINFLAARNEPQATEILVKLLDSESTRERAKTALQVNAPGRLAGLLEALDSANDESAPLIISVLSRMEKSEAKQGLLSAIKLKNAAARKAAATGLAARPEPEMISALQEAALVDPDQEVRQICTLLLHD